MAVSVDMLLMVIVEANSNIVCCIRLISGHVSVNLARYMHAGGVTFNSTIQEGRALCLPSLCTTPTLVAHLHLMVCQPKQNNCYYTIYTCTHCPPLRD